MSRATVPFVDMPRHYGGVRVEVDAAMARVFRNGVFILGSEGRAFEEEFAAYCGCAHGIGVGSGTDALFLALLAAGVEPGDEVVTVANTAVPTVSAISMTGATPVFVDVDPETLLMDPAALPAALSERTKVILPVHLYGQCADMDAVLAVARRHGCAVVEDACQAHGATWRGRRAGSMGDFGCFSFYPTKNLAAFGDAGMIVTNHVEAAARLRRLRQYGQVERYYHEEKGYNSRLDELQAAILRAKLPFLEPWTARRRSIAARYSARLSPDVVRTPAALPGGEAVFHLYVVRVDERDAFRKHLEEAGIQTLIHYPVPIHRQTAYAEHKHVRLPGTEAAATEIVSLPIYPEMDDGQVEAVIQAVNGFRRQ